MNAPIIDTHAHVYPESYLDELERIGVPASSTAVARGINQSDSPDNMRTRLDMMDAAGVDIQVLSAVPQLAMVPDPKASTHATQMVNDIYARLLHEYEGRFLAYGALPVPHADASIAELDRVIDDLGFVGVALPTVIAGSLTLADASLDPLWEALNERSARVYVHATGGGAQSPLLNDHGLEWVNGAPIEDAIAVLHLMKADVPSRFPDIRFHVAHLGGDLPFLARRIEDNYEDWHAFARSPLEMMRRMHFDAANFHGPSLRLAADTFGLERIMTGSDFPYFQDEKYTRAVSYIRDCGLGEADVQEVLSGNAGRFYGLN